MAVAATAPGPRISLFQSLIYRPGGANPLDFFTNLARTYGDVTSYRMGGEQLFLINEPRLIRDVLVTHNRNFTKSRGLERSKRLLGQGLLTSEGAMHLRQRRLMQPAFHRDRVAGYGELMVGYADRMRRSWADGATLDVSREMNRLTLSIVGKTLFDVDVEQQAATVGEALTAVMESFWMTMLPFAEVLERLPVPKLRRARMARARLDAIIYRMIADRRSSGSDRGDLLSMLLAAQDEDDGRGMTDQQVRDEAMTIFLPALSFIERVVTESMRLYPPAWIIGRRAIDEYHVGEYVAPPRSILVMSPYIMHRDERFYHEPERFDPDRWTPEFRAALPKFAYFPFGGGPRQCIGESFAWMELILVVATISQQCRLRLVPGHPVVPQPLITLRAKHGMRMTVEKR